MIPNRTNRKKTSPKQMELFKFNKNGKIEPNTKIALIRKQVLATKQAERAKFAAIKKETKLNERIQKREEATFRKSVIEEARKTFAETRKRKGYQRITFIDFLRLQSNYFERVANGYRAAADKDAIEGFEQKAKILLEEANNKSNQKKQNTR